MGKDAECRDAEMQIVISFDFFTLCQFPIYSFLYLPVNSIPRRPLIAPLIFDYLLPLLSVVCVRVWKGRVWKDHLLSFNSRIHTEQTTIKFPNN